MTKVLAIAAAVAALSFSAVADDAAAKMACMKDGAVVEAADQKTCEGPGVEGKWEAAK